MAMTQRLGWRISACLIHRVVVVQDHAYVELAHLANDLAVVKPSTIVCACEPKLSLPLVEESPVLASTECSNVVLAGSAIARNQLETIETYASKCCEHCAGWYRYIPEGNWVNGGCRCERTLFTTRRAGSMCLAHRGCIGAAAAASRSGHIARYITCGEDTVGVDVQIVLLQYPRGICLWKIFRRMAFCMLRTHI
ncbi:unnamed protein product [Phytophthora fragariaefolia]|uniref:Unnamed protein product n=1 Tax=Phytophthora fragariaefolia TaxID=1490495 RepID=A0A9W7D8E4_9STRA|nr:unnamed protein product [Phytophthora fragariaefolia]